MLVQNISVYVIMISRTCTLNSYAYSVAATYDCPRIVPTPPPCPTAKSSPANHITPTVTVLSSSSMHTRPTNEAVPSFIPDGSIRLHLATLPDTIRSNLIPTTTRPRIQGTITLTSAISESSQVPIIISTTPVKVHITPLQSEDSTSRSGEHTGLIIVVLVLAVVVIILFAILIIGLVAFLLPRKGNKVNAYTKILSSRSHTRDNGMYRN